MAGMNLRKVGLYVAIGIGLLLVARIVVSTVLAIAGFLWAAVTTAVTLLVLAGLAYGLYRGVRWLRDGGSGADARALDADAHSLGSDARSTAAPTDDADDPVERLTDRYVEGDLSEDELERRLDRALDGPDRDEIDRELERSRSE